MKQKKSPKAKPTRSKQTKPTNQTRTKKQNTSIHPWLSTVISGLFFVNSRIGPAAPKASARQSQRSKRFMQRWRVEGKQWSTFGTFLGNFCSVLWGCGMFFFFLLGVVCFAFGASGDDFVGTFFFFFLQGKMQYTYLSACAGGGVSSGGSSASENLPSPFRQEKAALESYLLLRQLMGFEVLEKYLFSRLQQLQWDEFFSPLPVDPQDQSKANPSSIVGLKESLSGADSSLILAARCLSMGLPWFSNF